MRISAKEFRWQYLPYGCWTCADGREVLFNRRYKPIWQRSLGGEPVAARPDEWVNFRDQVWFYNDGDAERTKAAKARAILAAWGVVCGNAPNTPTTLARYR